MQSVRDVQIALRQRGYDPGPADGILGRRTTAAIKRFQADKGLFVDGIAGTMTLSHLFPGGSNRPEQNILVPWYAELRRRQGLHEVRDRSVLMAWLRSDGRILGDPSKLPWCGDCIETPIALTLPNEPLPTNPYLARNWLKFGRGLKTPSLGAIMVFWRGSKTGTSGHVAMYAGEDGTAYHVLGGNQGNAISVVRIGKDRLIEGGIRWPTTAPLPTSGRIPILSVGDKLSTNEA